MDSESEKVGWWAMGNQNTALFAGEAILLFLASQIASARWFQEHDDGSAVWAEEQELVELEKNLNKEIPKWVSQKWQEQPLIDFKKDKEKRSKVSHNEEARREERR